MPNEKKPISEEKTAGASYILQFYASVQNLTHWYSLYFNFLLESGAKYSANSQYTEQDQEAFKGYITNMRYYLTQCNIGYMALKKTVFKENLELEQLYKDVNKTFIINIDDIGRVVIAYNQLLVSEVMRSLLENSQDIINNIYGGGRENLQ